MLFDHSAQADRIRLRGGTEIQGVVRHDPERPNVVLVQTMNGSRPLAFPREDIREVIREVDIFDEYDQRLADLPETAEARFEFGLWCEENRLTGLADEHYRRAIELDKDFGPAHRKLGHVQHQGQWISYDELREVQGLVQHEGQWIPREELTRIRNQRAGKAEHEAAVRQVRVLRQALAASTSNERADAERRLFEFAGPQVVAALVDVLGADSEPYVRDLLIRLLASVEGPEASFALVQRALRDPDPALRRTAVLELSRRGDPGVTKSLSGWLGAGDLQLASRAAQALAGLGAQEAVPMLINSLVRVERRMAWVPTTRAVPVSGPATGVNVTGRSIPVLTGAAVGDGAVAYGATSVPFASGAGIGVGSGVATPGPPELRVVTRVHQNPDVLAALEALTGRNFGFDTDSWKRWLMQTRRDEPVEAARRVLQP